MRKDIKIRTHYTEPVKLRLRIIKRDLNFRLLLRAIIFNLNFPPTYITSHLNPNSFLRRFHDRCLKIKGKIGVYVYFLYDFTPDQRGASDYAWKKERMELVRNESSLINPTQLKSILTCKSMKSAESTAKKKIYFLLASHADKCTL